jgi:hypothetical protein
MCTARSERTFRSNLIPHCESHGDLAALSDLLVASNVGIRTHPKDALARLPGVIDCEAVQQVGDDENDPIPAGRVE